MNGMLIEPSGPSVKKSSRRKKPRTNASPSNGVPKGDFNSEPPMPITPSAYPQSIAPTTLERSLASISHVNGGPDIPSFTIPTSLKQKKKPKKKKKPNNSTFADRDTDEDENPWMPVSSKKTKITKSQTAKQAVEPTATLVAPANTDVSDKKKRKRKSEKKTLPAPSTSSEETPHQHVPSDPAPVVPVSASIVSSSQPVAAAGDGESEHSKQSTSLRSMETPVTQSPQVEHAKPDAATVKAPSSQKTLLNYTQELEFLVAEVLGLAALVNTRTRFSELALPDLSALSNTPTALSATKLPPDVIQLRAHLRAKEAECQVLRDEVVRMHSDIIALKTAALSAAAAPPPPPPQPVQEKPQPVKVSCASKSVQSEPIPQETASSRPSDIVIMTLQEEIGRLAKESTLMSQRNAVSGGRCIAVFTQFDISQLSQPVSCLLQNLGAGRSCGNLEKRLSNLQSEMHRATVKATRTAEASAAERIEKSEARVKQLQVELSQKNQLLASQQNQLQALKEELSGASSQVEELQRQLAAKEMERESAVRKERLAAQVLAEARAQVEHLESSIKAEAVSSTALQQRIDQLMLDAERDHRLIQQLEADLANSKRELSATQESLASSAQQELQSIREQLDLAHTERDSLQAKLSSAQQELDLAHTERDSLQAKLSSAQHDLNLAYTERDSLQSKLSSAQQELDAAQEALASAASDNSAVEEIVVAQTVASTLSSAEHQEASSTVFSEEESCNSCSALASEVEHFKHVLDNAENVLSKLQTSAAHEEDRWRKSLQEIASENANLKTTVKRLTEEVADLTRKQRESNKTEITDEEPPPPPPLLVIFAVVGFLAAETEGSGEAPVCTVTFRPWVFLSGTARRVTLSVL
ncbi:unnamed protein product [Schistocephalus solidus]|uniref:Ribosome-binding protein 1 n=1 Tax=Schistocephalus solidus TaxID=70667 RepID=A0A183SYE0_SCHSO|nr:unnamed protein product [Schistocephalus solidus]